MGLLFALVSVLSTVALVASLAFSLVTVLCELLCGDPPPPATVALAGLWGTQFVCASLGMFFDNHPVVAHLSGGGRSFDLHVTRYVPSIAFGFFLAFYCSAIGGVFAVLTGKLAFSETGDSAPILSFLILAANLFAMFSMFLRDAPFDLSISFSVLKKTEKGEAEEELV